MIVITRKLDQGFYIGTRVHVVVQKVAGNRVQLGIQAPQNIRVARDEIFDQAAKPHQLAGHDIQIVDGERFEMLVMRCGKDHTYTVLKGHRLNICPYCGNENGLEVAEVDDAEEV